MAACGGRECRCSPARMPPSGGGDKRGQGHHMVPLPPLDSPKPSFAPRITVRGHPVQGGGVPLRKAPLRSRVYPWSSKRPCGPLAFRRATEGSRGAKEGLGCQEGKGNHRCPVPSCLRRESPAFLRRGHGVSRPPKAATVYAHSERKAAFSGAPLYRRKYTLC